MFENISVKNILTFLNTNSQELTTKKQYLKSITIDKLEELYCECVDYVIYDRIKQREFLKYKDAKVLLLEEFDNRK